MSRRRYGSGALWLDHLQIHGPHPALRNRPHLHSCHHHHGNARHPDPAGDEFTHVPPLRKLHLDRVDDGAAKIDHDRVMNDAGYRIIFDLFAFVLGAAIGSFLNVCIYRLPLDLSINKPRRSFCPNCKQPIPWQQNLPLLSWMALRGRCAKCGARIAFRYFAVELVTALLFLAIWQAFPWPIAVVYWVFISLLIVGTFVDLEHFIIPDQITIGGIDRKSTRLNSSH